MEVERKFLVREPPSLDGVSWVEIEQGYLAIGEGGEVRLRRKAEHRLLTVKRGSGVSREEAEIEISPEQFEALWPLTEGRRLRKRRHRIPASDLVIELDLFEGELEGLAMAEVEFRTEDEARAFEPPRWLGEEVTGKRAYLNESLAIEGPPAS